MRTAVIVGAGVAGLAAAGALARTGWQVTLIERLDRLGASTAAQLIWPNGVAALRVLGLGLDDVAFPAPASGIRHPDGRWLVAPAPERSRELDPVAVHADDLHDVLMAGLGEQVDIRLGTTVTAVRVGQVGRPSVGTGRQTFEADLIVAADGGHSGIRRRVMPASAVVSAGYTAWRAVIPWYRAPKLPEPVALAGEMLGAGQRFRHAWLGEPGTPGSSSRGGIYWAATAPGAPRPESAQTQLNLLRRWFAGWTTPVPELLDATEPQDLLQHAGEELRPLPHQFGFPVGAGGLVLLGDAAHMATPDLTQGACLAFEDAATLRVLLREARPGDTLAAAVAQYTLARRARVARVARASRRLGQVLQLRGRLSVRARDAALGRLAPRLLDQAAASAQLWRPPESVR